MSRANWFLDALCSVLALGAWGQLAAQSPGDSGDSPDFASARQLAAISPLDSAAPSAATAGAGLLAASSISDALGGRVHPGTHNPAELGAAVLDSRLESGPTLNSSASRRVLPPSPRTPRVGRRSIDARDLPLPESGQAIYFDPLPRQEISPRALFEAKLDISRAPAYAASLDLDCRTLFNLPPPRRTAAAQKFQKLFEEKLFREVRRHVRRQWKSQFRNDLSMTYAEYERVQAQISGIGKDPGEYDSFDWDYTASEVKQDLFRREKSREGESEIPFLTWGPFTVTDAGTTKFDLGTAAHVEEADQEIDVGKQSVKPLFSTKNYRIDTGLDFDVDPFRGYRKGSVASVVKNYGFTVEVDWLSDVLQRETISAQFEVEADLEGDFAVFACVVIKSR